MKHQFDKPFEFEGKKYETLDIPLEALTGQDISAAKREWAAAGNFSPVPAADSDFCASLAARACKLPVEFFYALPAKEYTKLTQAVSNFLLV